MEIVLKFQKALDNKNFNESVEIFIKNAWAYQNEMLSLLRKLSKSDENKWDNIYYNHSQVGNHYDSI